MDSLYDKLTQRFGLVGFVSFALVFISIFIEGFLGLNPSSAIMSNTPGLFLSGLLPVMFFGSCFFFFGLLMVLPNKVAVKTAGIATSLVGLVMVLMGGGVLAWSLSSALIYQPYYFFVYFVLLVFIIIPKGFFKTEKAELINFFSDKISITKNEGVNVTHYLKDIKMISIMDKFDGLNIYTNKGTFSYETKISSERLKEELDKLDLKVESTLVASARGKHISDIIAAEVDEEHFKYQTIKDHDNFSRTTFFIPQYNQWIDKNDLFILEYQYKNPNGSKDISFLKFNPISFVKPIVWIAVLLIALYLGSIFIQPISYLGNTNDSNQNSVLLTYLAVGEVRDLNRLDRFLVHGLDSNFPKYLSVEFINGGGYAIMYDNSILPCSSWRADGFMGDEYIVKNFHICEAQKLNEILNIEEEIIITNLNISDEPYTTASQLPQDFNYDYPSTATVKRLN